MDLPPIAVRDLCTVLGREVVHEGLALDVQKGEVVGVVGGSGSGKTALLRVLLGLLRPRSGSVRLFGKELFELPDAELRDLQERLGVLFQASALFTSLTVAENVEVPLREHGSLPPELAAELAAVKVQLVGLPESAMTKYPAELSGGMKKRAGLARALALDPEVLMLDEPTSGLDPVGAAALDDLVGTLRRSLGLTVLIVTHDLDTVATLCDRVAVLVDRRLVTGTLEELRESEHPWIRQWFRGPRARAVWGR